MLYLITYFLFLCYIIYLFIFIFTYTFTLPSNLFVCLYHCILHVFPSALSGTGAAVLCAAHSRAVIPRMTSWRWCHRYNVSTGRLTDFLTTPTKTED